jgi:hypothetical protein
VWEKEIHGLNKIWNKDYDATNHRFMPSDKIIDKVSKILDKVLIKQSAG